MKEHAVVAVRADGKFGFLMYEQFWETVAPQVEVIKTQQTPKPPAHSPEELPPLFEHSTLVRQVPFLN